jgi:hypothetical protein
MKGNAAVVAVDVVDGFVLYSASSPARKKAAINIDEVREDLQEAAAMVREAAAAANVDNATAVAAVGDEQNVQI